MAFDFPASPSEGASYSPAGGPRYVFTGGVWRSTGMAAVVGTAEARNRIVNGAMQHSQEWAYGATTFYPAATAFLADQWLFEWSVSPGTMQGQRVSLLTANGSRDRIRMWVGTAKAALGAGDYAQVGQRIEGGRVVDFAYGYPTVVRQSVLRFGFKAPAGTYSVSIRNSANNRTYLANFTVTAAQANIDTTQTIVIPGDTTGTWLNDTGIGLSITIPLAAGSSYLGVPGWQTGNFLITSANTNGMATAGNTFELFDVSLHLDPLATGVPPPWQMPDEAQELAACQRYYEKVSGVNIHGYQTTNGFMTVSGVFKAVKRIVPAISGLASNQQLNAQGGTFVETTVDAAGLNLGAVATGSFYWLGVSFKASARM